MTELDLCEDSIVDLRVEGGKLVVGPMEKRKSKYSLEELLAGITEENIHPETRWGRPFREEIW